MKFLRCRDVAERSCNFIAEGERKEEVERELLDHTINRHPVFFDSLDVEDREHFLEQMEAMMQDEKKGT
ncbi:MAG: DUF1059 domain-containing protein [Fibrobacter sp.]|nr:DUF1059 domain-containing protein [Fibrobacter sp.]